MPDARRRRGCVAAFPRPAGRVLFAGAEGARRLLVEALGADFLPLYRTVELQSGEPPDGDLVVLASASAARAYGRLGSPIPAVSIGPETSRAARAAALESPPRRRPTTWTGSSPPWRPRVHHLPDRLRAVGRLRRHLPRGHEAHRTGRPDHRPDPRHPAAPGPAGSPRARQHDSVRAGRGPPRGGRPRSRQRPPRSRARGRRRPLFVGPDNGLLVPAAETVGGIHAAHELTNPDYALTPVSATFHGRDVFSPAAANVALGLPLAELGPPIDPEALVRLELPAPDVTTRPSRRRASTWTGSGTCSSTSAASTSSTRASSRARRVAAGGRRSRARRRRREDLRRRRARRVDPVHGLLRNVALAVSRGNAAERLGAEAGVTVTIEVPG